MKHTVVWTLVLVSMFGAGFWIGRIPSKHGGDVATIDLLPIFQQPPQNNALDSSMTDQFGHPTTLYIEGEPRWVFKFLKRLNEEHADKLILSIRATYTDRKLK